MPSLLPQPAASRSDPRKLLSIGATLATPDAEGRAAVQQHVLTWLRTCFGFLLNGTDPVQIAHLSSELSITTDAFGWRFRLSHDCRQFAGRRWHVDVRVGTKSRFELTIATTFPEGAPPVLPSPPGFLLPVLEMPGLVDRGLPLSAKPRIVATPGDVDALVALLAAPERTRPVYVITIPRGTAPNELPIDPQRLQRQCAGLAHVVLLLPEAARQLSFGLGGVFSVWNGAVRTYRPGFHPATSVPFDHPVATLPTIMRNPASFFRRLVYEACGESLGLGPAFRPVPPEPPPEARRTLALRPVPAGTPRGEKKPETPDLTTIPDFIRTELAGRLVLHPRAERALKGARFRDVALIRDALTLLAREWRDLKLGASHDRDGFRRKLEALGLRASRSLSRGRFGIERSAYLLDWNGTRYRLDHHLKNNGNTRDPERCLRIYYFWDPGSDQVVIGHLPSHLPIAIS